MNYYYLIIIGLLTLSACNNNGDKETVVPVDSTSAPVQTSTDVSIPDADVEVVEKFGLRFPLVGEFSVQDMETFLLVCNSQDVKTGNCFTIEPTNDKAASYQTDQDLGGGKILSYESPTTSTGILQVNSKLYKVTSDPSFFWCIPYLRKIQPGESL